MVPFDKKELKQLQQIWYQKLKQEGFNDIEDTTHPNAPLHSWHSFRWRSTSPEKIKQTQLYYEKARALLHSYVFESEIHRRIWELHSEGFSKRKIEKTLNEKDHKRERIGLIIQFIQIAIK